ncbi:MAG: isopenicillin N synthase family oxygenase [Bacteriovoracaceae bacterium]|nr:isopenicillin N synthase family oxygenase [Bacteriovoracaceae bacterium]
MSETNKRKVPELSLMSYVDGNASDQTKFVDQLYSGLKDYGFIILKDHPIQEVTRQEGYAAVQKFFELPEEVKRQYICEQGGGQRGYTPFGTEHAKDNPYKDLKEFWHVGREVPGNHKFHEYYPENVWPEKEVPEFKEQLLNLYNALDKTSHVLLEALGRALDVPSDYFTEMINVGNSVLRAIHYPPVGDAPPAGSIRAAAHGDINLITILMGATASGLQLLDRDGQWLDVNTEEGQLVVDSGDMLSRITNDVIPATIHRVINPDDSGSERYSMPFFVHPHPEAILECIPSCLGDGAKYPPISAHDALMKRLVEIGLK